MCVAKGTDKYGLGQLFAQAKVLNNLGVDDVMEEVVCAAVNMSKEKKTKDLEMAACVRLLSTYISFFQNSP